MDILDGVQPAAVGPKEPLGPTVRLVRANDESAIQLAQAVDGEQVAGHAVQQIAV